VPVLNPDRRELEQQTMKTYPSPARRPLCRLAQFAALALLLGGAARLPAQDFRITGAYLRADGRIVLQYPANTDSYYVLHQGPLTNLTQAADVELGVNGTGELVGGSPTTNGLDGFFRVLHVPVTQPLDSDGDGWNDVDEITVGSNPLDPRSRPPMTVVSAPPVAMLLPANVGPAGLALNTTVANPPIALLLPANCGPEGLALNTTVANPPVAVLLPANEGPAGLALNTTIATPPAAFLLPADQGPGGLALNTTIATPPVALIPALDTDGDGIPDVFERMMGLDPTKIDSFGDGILDGDRDYDQDGLSNAREIALGTQPMRADSDSDGWNDETEATAGSNPFFANSRPFQMVLSSPPVACLLPANEGPGGLALNTTVALPPVALLLPADVGPEGLALNTTVANPPIALLLPANEGSGGLALNTTVALPPVALLLPADVGPAGLALNTTVANPPAALLLPANQGAAGLTNNTVLAQPPVRLQIQGQ
jgi:hypothetical protein